MKAFLKLISPVFLLIILMSSQSCMAPRPVVATPPTRIVVVKNPRIVHPARRPVHMNTVVVHRGGRRHFH